MCMVDYADASTTFHNAETHQARKPHSCGECGRTIEVGETYEKVFGVADAPFTAKTCAHCVAARHWLGIECHGWIYGGVFEDLTEHLEEAMFGPGQMDRGVLLRLCAGMRRQWRRYDGALMAVPVVTLVTIRQAA